MNVKAFFELDDNGTCNSFTMVRGKTRTHQFIKHKSGKSRLPFDGPEASLHELMRDIYGVQAVFRPVSVFLYVEVPDTAVLNRKVFELEDENKELCHSLTLARDEILTLRPKVKPSTFPPAEFIPKDELIPAGVDGTVKSNGDFVPDKPKLAPGSASLDPDATLEPKTGAQLGPALTPQEKRKATLALKKAGITPPPAPKRSHKKKKPAKVTA